MEAADFLTIEVKPENIKKEAESISKDEINKINNEINTGYCSVIKTNYSGKQDLPELEVKHEADQIPQTEVNFERKNIPSSSSLDKHVVKVENETGSYSIEHIFIKKEPESDYSDVNATERNFEVSIVPASSTVYNYPINVENDAHDIKEHKADQIPQEIFKQEPQSDLCDINFDQTKVNLERKSILSSSSCHKDVVKLENEKGGCSIELVFIKKEADSDYGDVNETERNFEDSIVPASSPIFNNPIKVENDAHDINQPTSSSDPDNNEELMQLPQNFKADDLLIVDMEISFCRIQNAGMKEVKKEPYLNEHECSQPQEKDCVKECLNTTQNCVQKHAAKNTPELQGMIKSEFIPDANGKYFDEIRICENVPDISDLLYICDHCNCRFTSKVMLLQHIAEHFDKIDNISTDSNHQNKLNDKKNLQNSLTLSNSSTFHTEIHPVDKPHQCSVCEKRFIRKANLNSHLRIHTGEMPYQCSLCEKRFIQKANLISHLKIHAAEMPYKCSVCEKRFNHSGSLNFHLKVHTAEQPHQCSVCDKIFIQKVNLEKHLKIHTREMPYQCSVCEKRFNQKSVLNVHLRTHTGEKPHQCSLCEKRFNRKTNLNNHLKIHTSEKPYHCSVCEKSFKQNYNLKQHLKTHTGERPFQCSVCQKKFNQKGNLNSHLKIHSDEQPHQCTVCKKTFKQHSNLQQHLKLHTTEMPYRCSVCNKGFNHKVSLYVHVKIHTFK